MTTPIRLISLSLRNFMSYGNSITHINLEFDEPTLIIGRNLDAMVNGQVDSNGSGKTTIINALSWGLYGKTISNISQDALINNINKKNMEVHVVFEKDGFYYKIIRFRKNKDLGGDGIKIFKSSSLDFDDNDIAESSVALVNKQIEKIIDMPYEIFSRIIIYSARHEPFFSLPVTSASGKANQSDIMEELTGLTELSRKGEKLNDEIKNNTKELDSLKRVQEEIEKQKAQYASRIEAIRARINQWDNENQEKIQETEKVIISLSAIDFDFQKDCLTEKKKTEDELREKQSLINLKTSEVRNLQATIDNMGRWELEKNQKISKITQDLEKFKDIDFDGQLSLIEEIDAIKNDIKTLTEEIKTRAKKASDIHKEMTNHSKEVAHLEENKCPYCLQKYVSSEEKLAELKERISDMYVEITSIESLNKSDLLKVEQKETKLEELNQAKIFKDKFDLITNKNKLENLTSELEKLTNQKNPFDGQDADSIKAKIDELNSEISSLKVHIAKYEKRLGILNEELVYKSEYDLLNDYHKLESKIKELETLKNSVNPHLDTLSDLDNMEFDNSNYDKINELDNLLTHQKFLYKLLTKKDSFIRKSLLTKSIAFLNERLKYYLDMLGLPHKVKFTEELTASISQFGSELDYGNLSSGQQARVNLALSFAFRDVLQKRYGKISFCILDECLDVGLGTIGVQMAAKMIKTIALKDKISLFIISHRDEVVNMFSKTMEIELEKGFSKIVKA